MIGQIPHKEFKKQGDYRWNHYEKVEEQRYRKEASKLRKLKEQAMEE